LDENVNEDASNENSENDITMQTLPKGNLLIFHINWKCIFKYCYYKFGTWLPLAVCKAPKLAF
jgi:hypothetical protein